MLLELATESMRDAYSRSLLYITAGGGSNGDGKATTHMNVHTDTPIAAARQRGARAAAASSEREDLLELANHLVHHHEASTRDAIYISLCHHSAAAPGYRALS